MYLEEIKNKIMIVLLKICVLINLLPGKPSVKVKRADILGSISLFLIKFSDPLLSALLSKTQRRYGILFARALPKLIKNISCTFSRKNEIMCESNKIPGRTLDVKAILSRGLEPTISTLYNNASIFI